jgi:hypothetical protein
MINNSEIQPLAPIWNVAAYLALSLAALGFVLILGPSSAEDFRRFFGRISPPILFLLLSVAGGVALWILKTRFGFEVLAGRSTLRGLGLAALAATVMGLVIVVIDFLLPYPENINVPYPRALLFYPSIGFAAEIVFHLVPLALLLLVLTPLAGSLGKERVLWLAILLAAAVEPTFQVLFAGEPLTWKDLVTFIHVFVFAMLQLSVFRRYDFSSMFAMRLVYYLYWHILWGTLRLGILF